MLRYVVVVILFAASPEANFMGTVAISPYISMSGHAKHVLPLEGDYGGGIFPQERSNTPLTPLKRGITIPYAPNI
ncbi:MAG: hypothetical protein AB1630_12800 [bacterium]